MKNMKTLVFAVLLAIVSAGGASALDLWRRPEAAGKNTVFVTAECPLLSFTGGFGLRPPEFDVDWMLPVFLPVSAGAYFKSPDPNLKSFGTRLAWHIDTGGKNTDLYFFYVFDFGWTRNGLLEKYGDEKQDVRYYDFRAGLRRLFGKFICFSVETDFHLSGISFGLALKI